MAPEVDDHDERDLRRKRLVELVVHDLRNPLAALLGTVELLREELTDHPSPTVREGLDGPGPAHNRVILQGGEELQLEPSGDLGEQNAGMLILVEGGPRPEYVPWTDVGRVDFDRPPAMYPPLPGR